MKRTNMTMTKPVIHILGLGSMGTVLAVDLLRYTNAQVIALLRNDQKMNNFQREFQNTVSLRKTYLEGAPLIKQQLSGSSSPESFANTGKRISNIVVTTKTYQTKEAITPYLPYIDSNTNLILIQNGLGVLELLKEEVFLDKNNRPNLFQGVIGHGVYQESDYAFNHAAYVGIQVARLPWEDSEMIQDLKLKQNDASENELMKVFNEPKFYKEFGVTHFTYQELLSGQLFKFLVNCCMNPVTAILDCVNGEMADHCSPIFRSIIHEALNVLRVAYKPLFEYEEVYNGSEKYPKLSVHSVLETEHMVKEVVRIGCDLCARNSSSMRQDTLNVRDTEIDYINGYVVHLAHKYNLSTFEVNKTIAELVNLRLGLNRTRKLQGDWRLDS